MNNIVIFDGVCNLCNWAVRFIIKHDSQGIFTFTSAQSETGKETLSRFGIDTPEPESVFLLQNKKLLKQSSAALTIAAELDGFWKYLAILRFIPRSVLDIVYEWIARNRYRWFGKRDVCVMPSKETENRFL